MNASGKIIPKEQKDQRFFQEKFAKFRNELEDENYFKKNYS
jgi:hypothetical protein